MPDRDSPHVRTLSADDLAGAIRLSTEAGWNQVAADWRRLLALWPQACLGIDADTLVATGTLATYAMAEATTGLIPHDRPRDHLEKTPAGVPGRQSATRREVGWIGMILVDGRCRGRGLGTAMMQGLLKLGRDRDLDCVGLDATDMGRPVYEKLGFSPASIFNRWVGSGIAAAPDARPAFLGRTVDAVVRPLEPADWPAVAALDADATGVERRPLLEHISREAGARAVVATDSGRLTAFGLARAGRTARAIGPLVAATPAAGRVVFESLRLIDGPNAAAVETALTVDVPSGAPLEDVLRDAGFAVSRRLTRMGLSLRPDAPVMPTDQQAGAARAGLLQGPCREATVYAGAGFELG